MYLILDKDVDELVKQAASININEVASEEDSSMKENDEEVVSKGDLIIFCLGMQTNNFLFRCDR